MSKVIRKSATIKTLEGITFADPCHEPGVWCRYDHRDTLRNVGVDFAASATGGKYPYTEFTLLLQPEKPERFIKLEGLDSILRPVCYRETEHEVGLDSACVYIGPYQENGVDGCGFSTGADGMFGNVIEYTYKGKWAGTLLLASFDTVFETPESLWPALLNCLGATEIKTKKTTKAA